MNALDAAVLAILLVFLARGIWVGLVRQLASLFALVLGFVAAGRYYRQFGAVLEAYLPSRLSFLLTYALLFLLVYLAIVALGFGLRKVVSVSLLGWFDRLMGGLFGFSKAVILASLLFLLFTASVTATSPLLRHSLAAPYLTATSRHFLVFIRDEKLQGQFLPKPPPAIAVGASAAVEAGKALRIDPKAKTQQHQGVPQGRP
ncbi:MAG: CvpA family protein [Thermodesulfobacteriota bacterium]